MYQSFNQSIKINQSIHQWITNQSINRIIVSNHEGDECDEVKVNEGLMVIQSNDGAIKSSNRITMFILSIECSIKSANQITM